MTILTSCSSRRFVAALFDLDDCLYRNSEVAKHVRQNIQDYMTSQLGVPVKDVEDMCYRLYVEHGTTMAGLVRLNESHDKACRSYVTQPNLKAAVVQAEGREIDYDDWHAHVHGSLDYQSLLKPNIQLRELLNSIELPRFVFTNSDRAHAETCLDRLGISDCFQQQPEDYCKKVVCKPHQDAFTLAMVHCGLKDPSQIIFMDDSVRNIRGAKSKGMYTVLVGQREPTEGADVVVSSLLDLKSALPNLLHNPCPTMPDDVRVLSDPIAQVA